MAELSEYMKTFSSFSGADIVATIGSQVFGELQAITYAVQREIAPVYTCGSSSPRSFSRGKRAIQGSLVFIVFDRDSLLNCLLNELAAKGVDQFTAAGNVGTNNTGLNRWLNVSGFGQGTTATTNWNTLTANAPKTVGVPSNFARLNSSNIKFLDQLPPFDITISMANEYGQHSGLKVMAVQVLNEGSGMSIDDMVIEKACSFVARDIIPMGYQFWAGQEQTQVVASIKQPTFG